MDISLILMIGHSLSALGLLALCFVQYKWKKDGRELKGLERVKKLKKHEEIGKKLLLSPVREGAAEGATQVTQNFADIVLNDAEINLLDNVDEAGVQGAIIGNGFAVAQSAALGRAKIMHTIASKEEKQNIQNGLTQVDGLAKELDNPNITKERKHEIKEEINSIIRDLSANEDLIADRFLKLSLDEKTEISHRNIACIKMVELLNEEL